jgi:uncharacterized membrane protein (DUF485 family)
MTQSNSNISEKKSLKERFFLIISLLFFVIYLTMGFGVLFWNSFAKNPLPLPDNYRIALGVVLIVYAFMRFLRFFQKP